jgi:cytochrome bd-type quinol oxidase subunit 2
VRGCSALAEFGIDLLIAIVVMFTMSIIAGAVWGIVRGVELAADGLDPAEIAAHIGEPGLLLQIGATALSLGTAALVLLLWRRRPTVQERAQSSIAVRRWSTWALGVGTGIVTTLLTAGISFLADAASIDLAPSNEAMLRAMTAQMPWLLIPFAVCLVPLYEEVRHALGTDRRARYPQFPWLHVVAQRPELKLRNHR